jgi:hypothetical protein
VAIFYDLKTKFEFLTKKLQRRKQGWGGGIVVGRITLLICVQKISFEKGLMLKPN